MDEEIEKSFAKKILNSKTNSKTDLDVKLGANILDELKEEGNEEVLKEDEVSDEEACWDENEAERIERKRSHQNKVYRFCYTTCTHWSFNFLITIFILGNTISLAADDFPQSIEKEQFLKYCNFFFTWLFFAEMVMKLVALGPKSYVRDFYNKFDAFIVIISLIDFTIG